MLQQVRWLMEFSLCLIHFWHAIKPIKRSRLKISMYK